MDRGVRQILSIEDVYSLLRLVTVLIAIGVIFAKMFWNIWNIFFHGADIDPGIIKLGTTWWSSVQSPRNKYRLELKSMYSIFTDLFYRRAQMRRFYSIQQLFHGRVKLAIVSRHCEIKLSFHPILLLIPTVKNYKIGAQWNYKGLKCLIQPYFGAYTMPWKT